MKVGVKNLFCAFNRAGYIQSITPPNIRFHLTPLRCAAQVKRVPLGLRSIAGNEMTNILKEST